MSIPNPSLDDTNFEEILQNAKRKISSFSKDWTNHNESDPGITLVELFSWIADTQMYSLNRITKKHYLKFLNLLGTTVKKTQPARIIACFDVKEQKCILAGTRLTSTENNVTFETDQDITVFPISIEKILIRFPDSLKDGTELLHYGTLYPFGQDTKLGRVFYLGVKAKQEIKLDAPKNKLSFYFEMYHHNYDLYPFGSHCNNTETFLPIKLRWEFFDNNTKRWVSLYVTKDKTHCLTKSGIIEFESISTQKKEEEISLSSNNANSHNADNQKILQIDNSTIFNSNLDTDLFWIRCSLVYGRFDDPPCIKTINPNAVPVIEGTTITEYLGVSSGLPHQIFEIPNKSIIDVLRVEVISPPSSLAQWKETEDLDSSTPDDAHFQIDYEQNTILFGDGINGDIPYPNSQIKITYRYGSIAKNLKASQISFDRIFHQNSTVAGSNNNTSTDNGGDVISEIDVDGIRLHIESHGQKPETIREAIGRMQQDLRVPFKAVSTADYEHIVRETPGIRVARATAISHPKNNLVTVVVLPYGRTINPTPTVEFLKTVHRHLDQHRLITTKLDVVGPNYIKISISTEILIDKQYDPESIRKQVVTTLNSFLDPVSDDTVNGWTFGRSVHRSEIYALIKSIKGIESIKKPYISATGKHGTFGYDKGRIWISSTSLVYPGDHSIKIT